MPKVSKKDNRTPLQEVAPVPMDPNAEAVESAGPSKPQFAPLSAYEQNGKKVEFRRVTVPQHRLTPLKNSWMSLYTPVTDNMKLDMRMNLKAKKVELKTNPDTPDSGSVQKAADFVQAFILGFDVADAIALLRLDDLYVEVFEVKDVKNGKTKFTIENATKTRIVIADTRIHILGSYQNIRVARDALCGLILGSPPGKVYRPREATLVRDAHKHDWAEAVVKPAPFDESVWLADTSGSCAASTSYSIKGKQQITSVT
ncbi:MAG: RNA-binding pno1-like [Trebouxia sp. A1-2]|nr:MAG: RNA-binding pno1-like [Trebouxia sp. A1-2]